MHNSALCSVPKSVGGAIDCDDCANPINEETITNAFEWITQHSTAHMKQYNHIVLC